MEGSQCSASSAFVSQIIKGSMVFVEQHSRPCSQLYRPQTGHSELRAKLLNPKQLRSDRGNWISVAANRFGSHTKAWCFQRFTTDQTSQRLKEIPSRCLFPLAQAAHLRGVMIVQSLKSIHSSATSETKQQLFALSLDPRWQNELNKIRMQCLMHEHSCIS